MKALRFDELHCKKSLTKPWYCHLEVKVDDSHLKEPYMLGTNLKAGQKKDPAAPFSKRYRFNDKISFSMELEDTYQLEIHAHERADGDGTFSETFTYQNNWEVEATYTVTDTGTVDPLAETLSDFRAGITVAANAKTFGAWQHLDHTKIVDRTEKIADGAENLGIDNVHDAYAIDQAYVGYCAPAAVMFCSAYRQPRRFVETVRSLYETTGFLTQTERHSCSLGLVNSPAADDLEDLEWLFCAALEDSNEATEDVTSTNTDEGMVSSVTAYWVSELLGYQEVWTYNAVGSLDEREIMVRANEAIDKGGAAILRIDGDLTTDSVLIYPDENAESWFLNPNHAVAMVDPMIVMDERLADEEDDDQVMFMVHDRGTVDLIDMRWGQLQPYLYGAIVGWT